MHPHLGALLDHHRRSQVALEHSDGDKVGRNLHVIERFGRQVRVAVAGDTEEQIVDVLPGVDDNAFENDFVDHGSLLIVS
jgi:hypothetical protein